jgi:hypothetical protein
VNNISTVCAVIGVIEFLLTLLFLRYLRKTTRWFESHTFGSASLKGPHWKEGFKIIVAGALYAVPVAILGVVLVVLGVISSVN